MRFTPAERFGERLADAPFFSDANDRTWVIVFAGVLAALVVLRLIALSLNGTDLYFDEAQYWYWSTEPAFGYYSKPPLIAWLIHGATDFCGPSEFCVRLPSPLLHSLTAIGVFALGSRIYDVRVGALSGIVYATLPAVSLSSGIISTDVPLLTAWVVALILFYGVVFDDARAWSRAVLLGLAIGVGLNAKYAMAWFFVCAGLYYALSPGRRGSLADGRFALAVVIALTMLIPNIVWNAYNGFATVSHTADNAKWSGALVQPGKALEFFFAQFGVFGPVLFAGLLIIAFRATRQRLPEADRFLLAFALPVVVLITVQAFLSRAHANWAAVSYVSASVLVTATMVRDVSFGWLKASLGIHSAVLALIVIGTTTAGVVALPGGRDPFARVLGWKELADETRRRVAAAREDGQPFASIVSDDRSVSSELLYYLRDEPTPIKAFLQRETPKDHFELKQPFRGANGQPVLLVSIWGENSPALKGFAERLSSEAIELPAGETETRTVYFFAVKGLKSAAGARETLKDETSTNSKARSH